MDLYLYITTFLLAAVAASGGLVAIWSATSRVHWFWRALAMWTFVAAMVPIRAYEPAVVFGIGLPLAAGVIFGASWFRSGGDEERRPIQFGLKDTFWAVLIVGMSLALLRQITHARPQLNAYEAFVPAGSLAALTITSYWLVAGRRRIFAVCILMGLIPFASWLWWPKIMWLDDVHTLGLRWDRSILNDLSAALRALAMGMAEFVVILCGMAVLMFFSRAGHRFVKVARPILLAIGVIWSLLVVWVYAEMWPLSPFPPAFGKATECSREVVRIAELVHRLGPRKPDFKSRSASMLPPAESSELRQLYDKVLPCFEQTNSLPFDTRTDITAEFFKMADNRIQWLRELCICFDAECREAEAKGDRHRALAMAIANLRLGTMCCRNGTSIEAQVGGAYLEMPLQYFVEVRLSFDSEEVQQVKAVIRRVEAELEPVELIQKRDVAYSQRECGWQGRLSTFVTRGKGEELNSRAVQFSRDRWHAISRLVMTDLAIRGYKHDNASWPKSLGELVPQYLSELPIDPYSGNNLIFRPDRHDFVLYSVGQDRQDNGGHFIERPYSPDGYDLKLDSLIRH